MVTARAKAEWLKVRECGEPLLEKRLLLKMKESICEIYVKPAILYGKCNVVSEEKRNRNPKKGCDTSDLQSDFRGKRERRNL